MRLPFLVSLALLLPLYTALGCDLEPNGPAASEDRGDLLDELPAQPLPLSGTPTAYGMLRVANELDFETLDHEVGLDRQAAESIIAYRAGGDDELGTADDRFVEDLPELDALYWLGEENLWRVQVYALLEGYAPELVPQECDRALAEVLAACSRVATEVTGGGSAASEPSVGCLEGGEPGGPATELFAQAGLPRYLAPALGYHAMLCGDEDAQASICALGVAGLADLAQGECAATGG